MHRVLAVLLTLLAGLAAHAEERRYAVLSLLSDQMTVVTHDMATGSSLDRNHRESFAVPGNVLDKRTVLAIDDALRRAQVKPDPILLFTSDPAVFAAQARLLDDDASVAHLVATLDPIVRGAHATHLILASKYRHDAMLQMADGKVGSGKLEGIGFYVDRTMRTVSGDTREEAYGFLAPYAYFRLSLIDLGSGRVLRDVPIYASMAQSAARSDTGNAWDAMTPQAKANALEALIRQETARAVPELLGH